MDKKSASEIATKTTIGQLESMLRVARATFKSWKAPSAVNKSLTKGYSFNVYWEMLMEYKEEEREVPFVGVRNMIHDFGDFLPDDVKPSGSSRSDYPDPWHQDPIIPHV